MVGSLLFIDNDIYQYHSVKDTGGSKTFRIVEPFSSQAIIFRLKLQRAKLSSCGYVRERTYSLFRYRICKLKLSSMCVCTFIYGPTKSFHLIFLWTRSPTCFSDPLLIHNSIYFFIFIPIFYDFCLQGATFTQKSIDYMFRKRPRWILPMCANPEAGLCQQ